MRFRLSILLLVAAPALANDECAGLEDLLRAGECFAGRQRWQEAEQRFRELHHRNPHDAAAVALLADTLVQLGQPFDATLLLEEHIATQPNSTSTLKLYARLLTDVVRDPVKAESVLKETVLLEPDDAEAWTLLGINYVTRGKSADAIRSFERAVTLAGENPPLLVRLAYSLGQAGQHERAEGLFKKAQTMNRAADEPAALIPLLFGEYLLRQQRPTESVSVLTEALLIDPHSSMGYYWRASAYEKLKQYEKAEADGLAALREGGQRKDVHYLLVRVYRAKKDLEKARTQAALVERLTEKENEQHALARAVRSALRQAEPLLREGRFAEAAEQYERLVELLPTFYEAHFALGMCYSQLGAPDKAETSFRRYLSYQPVSADGHAALGVLLLQQGRPSEAATTLREAIRLDPASTEPRKALAHIHSMEGKYAESIATLRPAAAAGDLQACLMLAEALLANQDPTAALSYVERVLKEQPGHPGASTLRERILRQR